MSEISCSISASSPFVFGGRIRLSVPKSPKLQPVRDGRFYSVVLTDTSYEAVDRALIGEDYSQGALFFATDYASSEGSWFATHLKRLFEYNGHVFFGYY